MQILWITERNVRIVLEKRLLKNVTNVIFGHIMKKMAKDGTTFFGHIVRRVKLGNLVV